MKVRVKAARIRKGIKMAFLNSAITVLQTLVIALGAGVGVWGVVNLLEGYGNDKPGAKSQGMKQLMAGGGVALIGTQLIPLLSGLFKSEEDTTEYGTGSRLAFASFFATQIKMKEIIAWIKFLSK